jgi:hypothetical protein
MLLISMPSEMPVWLHAADVSPMIRKGQYRMSGWRQLCVRAHPCMQGLGDAACLQGTLAAVSFTILRFTKVGVQLHWTESCR